MTEARSAEDNAAAAADLRAGTDRLARLVAGSLDLSQVLAEVATSAVLAIPGVEGAGIAVLRWELDDHPVVALAGSTSFVAEIEAIQYGTLNEGPSITAARQRHTVRSGSLGGSKTWPRFGPRVGRLGVHSAMAVPLVLPDAVVGVISCYARAKDAFGADAVRFGELFAPPAAVAVHNARILADALELTGQLQAALSTRPVIDQAVGIIRARTGRSAAGAFATLRAMSQSEQRKLCDVAEHIVDDAVHRARVRRAGVTETAPEV